MTTLVVEGDIIASTPTPAVMTMSMAAHCVHVMFGCACLVATVFTLWRNDGASIGALVSLWRKRKLKDL